MNVKEVTQNLTNTINDFTKCVLENANEFANKITGKTENKEIKLKSNEPKKYSSKYFKSSSWV